MVSNATFNNIYIIVWSCPGNMPVLPSQNMPKYYLDKTTLISLLYRVSNCPGNMPKYYPGNMPKYYPGNMPKYYSTKYHYRNLREVY